MHLTSQSTDLSVTFLNQRVESLALLLEDGDLAFSFGSVLLEDSIKLVDSLLQLSF